MNETFQPKILAFLCNWCSYAGADLAGVSRFQYPPNIRVIRTMCSGRVDPVLMLEGLRSGFEAVFVYGCHIGDCHYLEGNHYTVERVEMIRELLDFSGIGRERVHLRWVSAAEGQEFARSVSELVEVVSLLGPLDREKFKLNLSAVAGAFDSNRLRWLLGMERQLTERGNIYGEKLDKEGYEQIRRAAAINEYQKALILESLQGGPKPVREIAGKSGLPVRTVSMLLGDIEKAGRAELHSYEGTTPRFIRLDA